MAPVLPSLALAVLFASAAGAKAGDRLGSEVALSTYGLDGPPARWALWVLVITEGLLAGALAGGIAWAATAAAVLLSGFALAQATALATGRAGAPCGCLGSRGELSWTSVACTLAVAVFAALVPGVRGGPVVLAGALVAAAIAMTRAGRRPDAALDVAGEGPELGRPAPAALLTPGSGLRLAVFTSEGCRLCRGLQRQVEGLGALEVAFFDEVDDADAWQEAAVPGSPFAVVIDAEGIVRAKGTVNDRRHVESLLEAAVAGRSGAPAVPRPSADRRTFLARTGAAVAAVTAGRAIGSLVAPGEAEAYHFCGHIYTTDGCPHPTGLPRIDSKGFPLRARDGHRVDDLGRLVRLDGTPVDEDGEPLVDADGASLAPATRTRVCVAAGRRFEQRVRTDGAWYRCCGGDVRKLVDCCTTGSRRINGDRGLKGYCYADRKVFCVMYFQTRIPC